MKWTKITPPPRKFLKDGENMKVVSIMGGLGNQMFQFAFYKALQYHYPNEIIKMDITESCLFLHNGYELEKVFGIGGAECVISEKEKKEGQIFLERYEEKALVFEKKTLSDFVNRNVYYEGYWQSEKYFLPIRENIKKCFTFLPITDVYNTDYTQRMRQTNSVSIHIRRGDYVGSIHYICDLDYVRKAILKMCEKVQNPTFFIFSNDMDWCKEQLYQSAYPIIFVEGNQGTENYKDLYLMTRCKHHIIANSSFSWWGAFLCIHKNAMVLAPNKWFVEGSIFYEIRDIVPRNWSFVNMPSAPFALKRVYAIEKAKLKYKWYRFKNFFI